MSRAGTHLLSAADALYESLGLTAPAVSTDEFTIFFYEAGRRYGDLVGSFREEIDCDPTPWAIVREVFAEARARDSSGLLSAYVYLMLVGPRLLVTVHDLRESSEGRDREFAERLGALIISDLRAFGDRPLSLADTPDDWSDGALALRARLDQAGCGETFPLDR